MDLGHISDDVLLRYSVDLNQGAEFASTREHLKKCSSCTRRLDGYQTIAVATRERANIGVGSGAQRRGNRAIDRLEGRLAAEDIEAEEVLQGVLDTPFIFEYADLLGTKRQHTGGVVRRLCGAANARCEDQPLFAFGLAQTAIGIADALPDSYYQAQGIHTLRGRAWIEYSTACRALGRFDRALRALDRAASEYQRLALPEPSLNQTDFARAMVCWKLGRYDQALKFVRRSSAVYLRYGNVPGQLDALQVEAVILHRQGDLRGAHRAYLNLYREGVSAGDAEMVARAAQNLGALFCDAGNVSSAFRYFEGAIQILGPLPMRARVARARWGLALASLKDGDLPDAERRLRSVEREMDELGMDGDVIEVRNALARTLAALHRDEEANLLMRMPAMDDCLRDVSPAGFVAADLQRGDSNRHRYQRIIEIYLRSCYAKGTAARVSELSTLLEGNREHVSRTAGLIFGKPLRDVLRDHQFEQAERLLGSTRMQLDEVARSAGFGHQSTFYRVFRARFGMTPDEYRQKATSRE